MGKLRPYETYSDYGFEELLNDDFFIESIGNPTPESEEYWNNFLESGIPDEAEFRSAASAVRELHSCFRQIPPNMKTGIWDNIRTGIHGRRKKARIKFAVAAFLSAAACTAIAMVLIPSFKPGRADAIIRIADLHEDPDDTDAVRLLLAGGDAVELDEREAVITHTENGIELTEGRIIPAVPTGGYNRLLVPKGKMARLTLGDGTVMTVNADSKVVYPAEFTAGRREIYVEGEIFIDVAGNGSPFVVRTHEIGVEVLGTKFNFTSDESRNLFRVVLVSGSVAVSGKNGRDKTALVPDQMFEIDGGEITVETVDTKKYCSWVDKLYYMDREKLETVVERLSDFYGVAVSCEPQAGSFLCSGQLDLTEDVNTILNILCKIMPLTCTVSGDGYLLRASVAD